MNKITKENKGKITKGKKGLKFVFHETSLGVIPAKNLIATIKLYSDESTKAIDLLNKKDRPIMVVSSCKTSEIVQELKVRVIDINPPNPSTFKVTVVVSMYNDRFIADAVGVMSKWVVNSLNIEGIPVESMSLDMYLKKNGKVKTITYQNYLDYKEFN